MRIVGKGFCAFGDVARLDAVAHSMRMAKGKGPHHFLRAWRKHRGYTLEKAAERIGMTHQNLGKIERGAVPYNQNLLERLAEEYQCEPADLIVRDPADPGGLWSIYDQLSPAQRSQIAEIAKTIKRTGTDG